MIFDDRLYSGRINTGLSLVFGGSRGSADNNCFHAAFAIAVKMNETLHSSPVTVFQLPLRPQQVLPDHHFL